MSGLSRMCKECRECKFKDNCNNKKLEALAYAEVPKLSQQSIKIPKLAQSSIKPIELKLNTDHVLNNIKYSTIKSLVGGIGL